MSDDLPEHLLDLERAAWEAFNTMIAPDTVDREAQRKVAVEAAVAVQAAITEHAQATGVHRVELEMAVKNAVRSPGV